MTEDFCN